MYNTETLVTDAVATNYRRLRNGRIQIRLFNFSYTYIAISYIGDIELPINKAAAGWSTVQTPR